MSVHGLLLIPYLGPRSLPPLRASVRRDGASCRSPEGCRWEPIIRNSTSCIHFGVRMRTHGDGPIMARLVFVLPSSPHTRPENAPQPWFPMIWPSTSTRVARSGSGSAGRRRCGRGSGWTVSALAFASAPGRPSGFHRRTQRTGLSTSWGLASTVVCSSIAGVTASQGVSEYERARDAAVGLQWTLISGLCGRGAYLPLSPREEHC